MVALLTGRSESSAQKHSSVLVCENARTAARRLTLLCFGVPLSFRRTDRDTGMSVLIS